MPLQAAMKRAAAELRHGVSEAAHDIIQRQQGTAPELDDDGLLGRGQGGAAGLTPPHGGVGSDLPGAPSRIPPRAGVAPRWSVPASNASPPCVREVVRRLEMISHFQRGGTEG